MAYLRKQHSYISILYNKTISEKFHPWPPIIQESKGTCICMGKKFQHRSMKKYLTKSPFKAGVPEYWMLMSSPWLAHTEDTKTTTNLDLSFSCSRRHMKSMMTKQPRKQLQPLHNIIIFLKKIMWKTKRIVLTDFEFLIKILMRANSFFSTKNPKPSKLKFQHFSANHALQPYSYSCV